MTVDVSLVLPVRAAAAAATARLFVEETLRRWKCRLDLEDALIVTTELVQNALEHTPHGGELRLRRKSGALIIEVSDASTELPVVVEHEDYASPRGRGLRMVQVIAASWGVRRRAGGKVVWAELKDSRRAEPGTP